MNFSSNFSSQKEKDRKLYDLQPFIDKIGEDGKNAITEMKDGKKESHWIWYFFPQLDILGFSHNAKYYGLQSLDEAEKFLQNEKLRLFLSVMTRYAKKHLEEGKTVKNNDFCCR